MALYRRFLIRCVSSRSVFPLSRFCTALFPSSSLPLRSVFAPLRFHSLRCPSSPFLLPSVSPKLRDISDVLLYLRAVPFHSGFLPLSSRALNIALAPRSLFSCASPATSYPEVPSSLFGRVHSTLYPRPALPRPLPHPAQLRLLLPLSLIPRPIICRLPRQESLLSPSSLFAASCSQSELIPHLRARSELIFNC